MQKDLSQRLLSEGPKALAVKATESLPNGIPHIQEVCKLWQQTPILQKLNRRSPGG